MPETSFAVQWHLTTACGNSCKHCYMDRNRKSLSLEKVKAVVQDIKRTTDIWRCQTRISFSGGDPLIYSHFWDLLSYTRQEIPDCEMLILGNPEPLTEEVIERLIGLKVGRYQVSLDGMEETHDYFRYPGSFRETIRALERMKKIGLKSAVMSTVSMMNISEMPSLVGRIAGLTNIYDFSRFISIGRGTSMESEEIPPLVYRQFLVDMAEAYKRHKGKGTRFGRKEPLWKLLQYDEGEFKIPEDDRGLIWSGCTIGMSNLTILEDGEVLACRRIPYRIGKVPEQSIRDIFISSKKLNRLREYNMIDKCGECELRPYCRGCRATASAATGRFFAEDPQCWKGEEVKQSEKDKIPASTEG